MIYAMTLQNIVIGLLPNQETEPYWAPDPEGNPVTPISCDDTVELGMVYHSETGAFSAYIPPELDSIPKPTETEIIMQAFTDAELRDLEIRQGQEMLAQQMADIELAVMGGKVV